MTEDNNFDFKDKDPQFKPTLSERLFLKMNGMSGYDPTNPLNRTLVMSANILSFNVKGRLGQIPFIYATLWLISILIISSNVQTLLDQWHISLLFQQSMNVTLVIILYLICLRIIFLRLHDINRSGLYVLLLIPLSAIIPLVLLILSCIPGSIGVNRFGNETLSQKNDLIKLLIPIGTCIIFWLFILTYTSVITVF